MVGFMLVVGRFVPVGIMRAESMRGGRFYAPAQFGKDINVWIRSLGTVIACLMLLAVAVRASSTVSGERDRPTLDALLASPRQSGTILFAKWVGSICRVPWVALWLGLVSCIAPI